MSNKLRKNRAIVRASYDRGVSDHKAGKPDINPYGNGDMMKMTAWSAGYFDSKRGMV